MYRYTQPVPSNNRKLREQFPEITEYFEAAQKEALTFPQVDGMVRDTTYVSFQSCPICGESFFDELFLKWGGLYVQCRLCSHVYVYNVFRPGILHDLYEHSITNELERKIEINSESIRYWSAMYAKYISLVSLDSPDARIFDIGAGAGGFLKYLHKNHPEFKLSALELAKGPQKLLSSLVSSDGYFYSKPLEKCDCPKNHFDFITLWGVLEHVTNPVELLQKITTSLKVDGTCLILIPNLFSHAFKILGIQVPTLNPREHINFYTEKSMDFLAHKCSLKVEQMHCELPIIDLMYPFINHHEGKERELIEQITRAKESYYHVYLLKKNS